MDDKQNNGRDQKGNRNGEDGVWTVARQWGQPLKMQLPMPFSMQVFWISDRHWYCKTMQSLINYPKNSLE